jgi:hypothetical protein
MQRPTAKAVATGAALLILLAGCGGKDDSKGSDAPKSGDTPATPAPPPVASFDPPKGFTPASAFGVLRNDKENQYTLKAGMVGQTSLVSANSGLTGRNIAAQHEPWSVPSSETPDTIVTTAHTTPMPVQVDGKDVVAIAYLQKNEGGGTQKVHGQILIQWLDAADGTKVGEVTVDLSQQLGPGGSAENVVSQAFDQATGQLALAFDSIGDGAAKKVGDYFTLFADPKTQRAGLIPNFIGGAVLNGKLVGTPGDTTSAKPEHSIVFADGASAKVTKKVSTKEENLKVAGSGTKHVYLTASTYAGEKGYDSVYNNAVYSVDIATEAVVQTKSLLGTKDRDYFVCRGDRAAGVVCNTGQNEGTEEIIGFDDNTGKKVWGYTKASASRVVPSVTAAFHGVVYGYAGDQTVMLNISDGQDIPRPAGSMPSATDTPSDGTTSSGSPSSTPSDSSSAGPGTNDPSSAFASDMSLYDPHLGVPSPTAVTQYGAAYLQGTSGNDFERMSILIALKPIA